MIPKIIHYCWFGGNPLPDKVQMCIDTWKRHLSDYKFILWNENNSPIHHPFVQEAMRLKKYAFASDYVRLWAIHKMGGIYLDTDMYVVKSFDDLLHNRFFCGYENSKDRIINAAIFGSEPHFKFIEIILKKYDTLQIPSDVSIETITIPRIITDIYNEWDEKEKITIYPYDYFYPLPQKKHRTKNFVAYSTENTYAIHLWNLSWLTIREKILLRFYWFAKSLGIKK